MNAKTLPMFSGRAIFDTVTAEIKYCPDVQSQFKILVGYDISHDKLCETLLDEILRAWVSSKTNQAVKKYTFDKRTSAAVARMGTPAMRKTLDKV